MKALYSTITLLAACSFVAAPGFAEEAPGALSGYNFPVGSNLKLGQLVRPAFSEDFQKSLRGMIEKLGTLPQEKRAAVAASFDATVLPAFDAELWDQASYNAYKAAFKETKIQPIARAALGLQPLGDNTWRLNTIAIGNDGKSTPLSIGALRYNSAENTWTSNNGKMRASSYTGTTDSIYGPQNGTEWKLEKKDDLSRVAETLRFTKTTDGKYIYVTYQFREDSVLSGSTIAQDGYTLRFSVGAISASVGNQTKH